MKERNPNVTGILTQVHEKMKAKYAKNKINEDIAGAKALQNFLQQLKQYIWNRKHNIPNLKDDLIDMILDTVVLPNGRSINNLFFRTGQSHKQGQYFEEDLAAVIVAIEKIADPNSMINNKEELMEINIGSQVGTTDINKLDTILEDIAEDVTEGYAKELEGYVKKENVTFTYGKVDTRVNKKIVNLNGSIQFPAGVLEALSNATFTDKSYKSKSWQNGTEIELGERNIHLGKSNSYRSILGSMSALGYANDFEYVYYAGRNIIKGKDTCGSHESPDFVSTHFYHLRYMYELTGAGIYYKNFGDQLFSGAKYLIYNDPTSIGIWVVSTGQIINELIEKQLNLNNPYQSISISSSAIKAMYD